jgi:hypothetical protein
MPSTSTPTVDLKSRIIGVESKDSGSIGPALPKFPISSAASDDDDLDVGPSLPPPPTQAVSAPEEKEDAAHVAPQPQAKKNLGPALPTGIDLERLARETSKVDWQRVAQEEEEEEFDMVGPAMPGRETIGYLRATEAAHARILNNALTREAEEAESSKPKHEAWMTMLPEHRDLSLTLEQLQQNRTFQRKEKETTKGSDTSAWTDTPADKERKEREKQMGLAGGKRKHEEPAGPDTAATAKRLIEQYNQVVRPKTLVEIHQEKLRSEGKASGGNKELTPGSWDRSQITQNHKMDNKTASKM